MTNDCHVVELLAMTSERHLKSSLSGRRNKKGAGAAAEAIAACLERYNPHISCFNTNFRTKLASIRAYFTFI
jgi:hypothetical protein